jgi:hypothetical protein
MYVGNSNFLGQTSQLIGFSSDLPFGGRIANIELFRTAKFKDNHQTIYHLHRTFMGYADWLVDIHWLTNKS